MSYEKGAKNPIGVTKIGLTDTYKAHLGQTRGKNLKILAPLSILKFGVVASRKGAAFFRKKGRDLTASPLRNTITMKIYEESFIKVCRPCTFCYKAPASFAGRLGDEIYVKTRGRVSSGRRAGSSPSRAAQVQEDCRRLRRLPRPKDVVSYPRHPRPCSAPDCGSRSLSSGACPTRHAGAEAPRAREP